MQLQIHGDVAVRNWERGTVLVDPGDFYGFYQFPTGALINLDESREAEKQAKIHRLLEHNVGSLLHHPVRKTLATKRRQDKYILNPTNANGLRADANGSINNSHVSDDPPRWISHYYGPIGCAAVPGPRIGEDSGILGKALAQAATDLFIKIAIDIQLVYNDDVHE